MLQCRLLDGTRRPTVCPTQQTVCVSQKRPGGTQRKRIREEEEEQRSGARFRRKAEASEAEFAPTIGGCTGFDGGMEAG